MAGRPKRQIRAKKESEFFSDPVFWEKLWRVMSQGESISKAIKHFDVSYHKTLAHINHSDELRKDYEAANVARALYHADRIEQLAEGVEAGVIDTNAAKVSMDARKWIASKLDPNRWGDRSRVDITTTDVNKLHLEAIRALGLEEQNVIEHENIAIEHDR